MLLILLKLNQARLSRIRDRDQLQIHLKLLKRLVIITFFQCLHDENDLGN